MKSKISDKQLTDVYKELKSVWETGKVVGLCGQSVHERLVKLGVINKIRELNSKEKQLIIELYNNGFESGDGKLLELSKLIHRTPQFISRYAKIKNLTNRCRNKSDSVKESVAKNTKKHIKNNGHPRGMLNKTHTKSVREIISKSTKKKWSEITEFELYNRAKKAHDTRLINGTRVGISGDSKKSWKAQWATIGNKKHYYRSKWEVNYAYYLEFLKKHNKIIEWEYEPETFWFESIKRGVRSYKPDFRVTLLNVIIEYHEVKGWMDSRSRTTISRFKKYYPDKNFVLIDSNKYKEIKNSSSSFIPGWLN